MGPLLGDEVAAAREQAACASFHSFEPLPVCVCRAAFQTSWGLSHRLILDDLVVRCRLGAQALRQANGLLNPLRERNLRQCEQRLEGGCRLNFSSNGARSPRLQSRLVTPQRKATLTIGTQIGRQKGDSRCRVTTST